VVVVVVVAVAVAVGNVIKRTPDEERGDRKKEERCDERFCAIFSKPLPLTAIPTALSM
jgi:hypothetical protein